MVMMVPRCKPVTQTVLPHLDMHFLGGLSFLKGLFLFPLVSQSSFWALEELVLSHSQHLALSLQPPFTPFTPLPRPWPLLLAASQTPLDSPPLLGPGLLL